MSDIKKIGEFGLIETFADKFNHLLDKNNLGIGDDAAVIRIDDDYSFVVTTDMLVEKIHFISDKISPQELGQKSLIVNLSDIAAMGAVPVASFLSVAINKNTSLEYVQQFTEGYLLTSNEYKVPLMGGDTTKSPNELTINVCVIGKIENKRIKYRHSAQDGDIVCVTGFLGDSAAGLSLLYKDEQMQEQYAELIKAHHLPIARVDEGRFLSSFPQVHAMMDISDGIGSDLKHISKASKVSINIDTEKIPLSEKLQNYCQQTNKNPLEFAISGGEDYELLFTVDKDYFNELSLEYQKKFGRPIFPIGTVRAEGESPEILYFHNNKRLTASYGGFDHFKTTNK